MGRIVQNGKMYPILGSEQAAFCFTISLLRSTTFSENHSKAKHEYPQLDIQHTGQHLHHGHNSCLVELFWNVIHYG
jgi:hypothetical protein